MICQTEEKICGLYYASVTVKIISLKDKYICHRKLIGWNMLQPWLSKKYNEMEFTVLLLVQECFSVNPCKREKGEELDRGRSQAVM